MKDDDDPFASTAGYLIHKAEQILTPALAIYPELVDRNISSTLRLLDGDPNRWRPHVKTAKLAFIMSKLVERGVVNFKASTTLELLSACKSGAADVLLAYPAAGAVARRTREIAGEFRTVTVSALVESVSQLGEWSGGNVGAFIDVNPGMNRTGVEQDKIGDIVILAKAIVTAGLTFRGLHYYDGHLSNYEMAERELIAHRGYGRLLEITAALNSEGVMVEEIITAGTPAFPCTISYPGFKSEGFIHRASPGTVVYGDCSSLAQLPREFGYRPAAIVASTVVSHPCANRITCDAGHKTVSADAGAPTCRVLGRPDLIPKKPSEEHLPVEVAEGSEPPAIGDILYLVPKHVCPTVNNFDHALIVEKGEVVSVKPVTARGREIPLIIRAAAP